MRTSPSPDCVHLLFPALIFPLSGQWLTGWQGLTSWNNNLLHFYFDPFPHRPLRSPREGQQSTLQRWGEHLRDLRESKLVGQPPHPATYQLPTRLRSGQSWQLDICFLLPLSQNLPVIQIKGAHTRPPLLWVAVRPSRASPVWTPLTFSQTWRKARRRGWGGFYDML